jgi:hypothetical protein
MAVVNPNPNRNRNRNRYVQNRFGLRFGLRLEATPALSRLRRGHDRAGPKRPSTARELTASAAATTTTSTAAPTAIAASATPAATAAAVFFTRTGFIDSQGAALNFLAREGRDGGLGGFRGAHGDKREAARTSTHAIGDQVNFGDRPVLGEKVLQVVFCCVEGKISYVQFRIHVVSGSFRSACWFPELFPEVGFQIIIEPSSPEDSPCWKFDNTI